MCPDALACADAVRAHLAGHGLSVRAPVEECEGLLSAFRDGTVRLALPTLDSPRGALRATLLGGLMGLEPRDVAWLFQTLLPRLVAHEFGHALRAEAGLLGADVCVEEQVADRVATLVSRSMIPARERSRAGDLLGEVVARLGGAHEAASLHRHAEAARRTLGLGATPDEAARAREALQRDYWRDVNAYLRLTAAWAWIDLTLHHEDDFDALRRDHLQG